MLEYDSKLPTSRSFERAHNEVVTGSREALLEWSTHAREQGDPELARGFLLAWVRTRPHDRPTFLVLRARLGRLGFLADAIEAQREVVAITTGHRRLADELIALAILYREAGDVVRAREALAAGAALVPVEERGAALAGRVTREHALLDDVTRPGTAWVPGRVEQ